MCAASCISIALLACASNGDPFTPDNGVAGAGTTYVLRTVAGDTVPSVWISNPSVTVTVIADTIRLQSRGQGERVLIEEYRETAGAHAAPRREAGGFDYVRRNDRVEITLPCPDLGLCVAPPHFVGRVTPEGLIFDHALNYSTPLRYQRISR